MLPLAGGVAVVTGAASGIGAALAVALAGRGCHLALVDRDVAGLAAVAANCAGVTVSTHVVDLADRDAILALPDAVVAAHGKVTILFNNAGVALGGQFNQISLDDFAWVIDINLYGVVRTTHAFLPILRAQNAAQIVNVSSIFGIVGQVGQTAYCASKFAVRGFSEALRAELVATGIGVTVVHPGGVATAIARSARRGHGMQNSPDEDAALTARMQRSLKMPPPRAAAIILRAIERRQRRVLVGRDARIMAVIQWLFPVRYQTILARLSR